MTTDEELAMIATASKDLKAFVREYLALRRDAERLAWVESALFERKWNGVIDKGSETHWSIAGDWRHTCYRMVGHDFRSAIDAAMCQAPATPAG